MEPENARRTARRTGEPAVCMEKQRQDSNVSQLSLDQRFSGKERRSSARLRHQSLDRGMDRPSLDERFGGTGQRQPMTASHCRWTQASCTDRQTLDQRFSKGDYRLSATGLHHLKTSVEQQDNGNAPRPPMAATKPHGQRMTEPSVAAAHDCNVNRPSSSHSIGTSTNVDGWTSDEPHQLSISASAGAQLWNTDKANETEVNWKSAAHDTQASISEDIGSTESRLAVLRWSLDYNESDRPSPLHDGIAGQRPSPLAASSAQGGSSEDHPSTESPGGRKRVDVDLQVDLESCSTGDRLVTCQTDPPHCFSNKLMLSYFKYYIIKTQQLKVLWLCRCVQAWCFFGCGPTSGGVEGVREGFRGCRNITVM